MKEKLSHWLQRKTSSNAFIPEIDGFRFFAIFTVVIYHLNTHLSRTLHADSESSWLFRIAAQGGVGVTVFFAISGFILALPFARQHLFQAQHVDLKSYYIRRVTRLEPPYVISLIILLFVHVYVLNEHVRDIFGNFLASLFYVHGFVYDSWSKINPVAWSLEVEVQFYILAPFLAMLFGISRPVWRRAAIISLIVASMIHYNYNFEMLEALHLRKSILMHLHQFLIGFLFADFYLTDWRDTIQSKSYYFDIIGIVALSGLLALNSSFDFPVDLAFGITLFISFLCVFRGRILNAFFTSRWVVIVGGMCYSIYLLHYALIAFLTDKLKMLFNAPEYGINLMYGVMSVVPIVLVVSAVFFVLIERPCMDKTWPHRAWRFLTDRKSSH